MNPLFPTDPGDPTKPQDGGYVLPNSSQGRKIEPLSLRQPEKHEANPAADLIRSKIDALFADEPSAKAELTAEAAAPKPHSKHQRFMHDLSTSGKSLAEIQTAWHQHYAALPDHEKQEVWQEFYAANSHQPAGHPPDMAQAGEQPKTAKLPRAEPATEQRSHVVVSEHASAPVVHTARHKLRPSDQRSVASIKKQVLHKVRLSNEAQLKAKRHLQSLVFGISSGALVLLVFLFGFFNEVVITPFIQPGHANATPIILSSSDAAPSPNPEVIIPKINVELPTIYGTSVNENDIENSLQDGVIHYPSTSVPGQQGNVAVFGHSSNNIFSAGNYKFAFVLLHTLVPGDIFYLTYNNKVYTYKVYDMKVVAPSQTWVLNPVAGHTATATLITCDPPGTSRNRLVVWGDQISPDPNVNAGAPAPSIAQPTEIAGNGPSLWSKFWNYVKFW